MKLRLALLLFTGVLTLLTAGAQTPRAGAGLVDSREECAALDGAWKPSGDTGPSACEVPWSRDDCLRLGGAWTQAAKAAGGGRCLAGVSEFAKAQQCLDRGGSWGPQGARNQACTFEPPKPRVAAATRAPDAGKLCDSQKDCLYGCIYQGPPVATRSDVMGHCRATSAASGCYSMVEAGRLAGSVCVK